MQNNFTSLIEKNNKSGLDLVYRPLKNNFFKYQNKERNLIRGHFDLKKIHYTSLIFENNHPLLFNSFFNLFREFS